MNMAVIGIGEGLAGYQRGKERAIEANRANEEYNYIKDRRAIEDPRNDELANMNLELKRNDLEIARILQGPRSAEALRRIEEINMQNYGQIYKMARMGNTRAAAQAFNRIFSNRVKDAQDIIFYKDEAGNPRMKIVGVSGEPVESQEFGVLDFDQSQLENMFGPGLPEAGTFKESERGVLDTRTGAFSPHKPGVGGGLPKGYSQQRAYDQLANELGKVLGGKFDPLGNLTLPDGTKQTYSELNAIAQRFERMSPGSLAPGELAKIVAKHRDLLVSDEDALRQANAEAEARDGIIFEGGEEEFGPQGRAAWIQNRAREIVSTAARQFEAAAGSELGLSVGTPGQPQPPQPPALGGQTPQRALPVNPAGNDLPGGGPSISVGASGQGLPEAPLRSQRKPQQIYKTPKGPLKWTGTGWVTPTVEDIQRLQNRG